MTKTPEPVAVEAGTEAEPRSNLQTRGVWYNRAQFFDAFLLFSFIL